MNRKRWLVTAAAGLAAVLGGGAALAATGSDDPSSDFLGDVAKRLGVTQDKLEGAIEGASIDRIDRAVARGDLTKEQGEELKKHVRSGDGPVILPGFRGPKLGDGPMLGIGPPGPPRGKGFFRHGKAFPAGPLDLFGKAADYLDMDEADVHAALRDGKSLADLAKDKGKSVDGLEQALRDAIRAEVGNDRVADKLASTVDELVEGRGFKLHFRVRPGDLPLPDAPGHPPFAPA